MSSVGPSKKPYRKAPPQHRESRHDTPSARGEEPPEQLSKVTAHQRKCLLELQEADGSDFGNVSCSSSWSLASSNDKEWEGPRGFRSHPLLRRVKSLRSRGKQSRGAAFRGLRRFLSRSEENVSRAGRDCGKTRSLERSLVFKEPAEVLTPNKGHKSHTSQPLKSILKHPGSRPAHTGRGGASDRKSFSRFLDEITSRVLSPTNVQAGRRGGASRRGGAGTDKEGSGSGQNTERTAGPRSPSHTGAHKRSPDTPGLHRGRSHHTEERSQTPSELGYLDTESLSSHWSPEKSPSPRTTPSPNTPRNKDPVTDGDRISFLQLQNDELRRRLAFTTTKMEAMEHELDAGRHYLEAELNRHREELEKLKDKFRRLQNSYTASQRTNQDLEEKLHTLASFSQSWIYSIKKAEVERKTLDWEIVELTNKLLDAKTTVNRLEELNERYRQDCNLAVQLLKCNKSHFRNHKFADLPYKLQDMVNRHLQSGASGGGSGPDTPPPVLSQSDVVPTSVIARVLEKPESLILNSATSSSGSSGPTAEDVFVHVDMSGGARQQQNGVLQKQGSVDSGETTFDKLSPYPTPPPPHPLYPGRKVIEFSDDKVQIPKNSPLPNCTYATRQAISLSLVQGGSPDRHRTAPNSPASSATYPQRARSADNPPRSPVSSAAPSSAPSSASSEEDMLANWQRMFVEKSAPSTDVAHRTSYSRDSALELQQRFSRSMQELSRAAQAFSDSSHNSWASNHQAESTRRAHLPDEYGRDFSREEAQDLLSQAVEEEEEEPPQAVPEEEEGPQAVSREMEEEIHPEKPPIGRPPRSPKRMGVHHLHRKDSLTRAQEHGNLLN